MKYKGCIFDLDGVLVCSEELWAHHDHLFLIQLLGKEKYDSIKDKLIGLSIKGLYEIVKLNGNEISYDDFTAEYDRIANLVYTTAPLNFEFVEIIEKLSKNNVKLGIVSNSARIRINQVLTRLGVLNKFSVIISYELDDPNRPKPFPDGYLRALELMGLKSEDVIAIEDSNNGITAAKSAGLCTICYSGFLDADYQSLGYDYYVGSVSDISKLLFN